MLATGGLALLPRALSGLLRPTFKESREVGKGWRECGRMWEGVYQRLAKVECSRRTIVWVCEC